MANYDTTQALWHNVSNAIAIATHRAVSKAKRHLPRGDSSFAAGVDLGGAVGVAMELDVGSRSYSPPDCRKVPRPKPAPAQPM